MVGNVYLNRGITGAIVERHPFGGFKMSGGGTKAGGLGYLENFLFPRAIAENILRRGFTPSEAASRPPRSAQDISVCNPMPEPGEPTSKQPYSCRGERSQPRAQTCA